MVTRYQQKILTRSDIIAQYARPRSFTLVFTNGVFDILHRGHVEYLARARNLGDALIVGVNTDASVRRLKGPERPIHPENDRAVVLAALEVVDAVTLFDEDTPLELISAILPDVLVKGSDYERAGVVGGDEVERAGGRVELIPLVEGRSTTSTIRKISERK